MVLNIYKASINTVLQEKLLEYNKKILKYKKICFVLILDKKTNCRGINIDLQILYNKFKELKYNVNYMNISFNTFNFSMYKYIKLDYDIYIYSEIIKYNIYSYLLERKKQIIYIPNIDIYNTFNNDIMNVEKEFISVLKKLETKYPNYFFIWCKTKQIYNWLNKFKLKNITYISFNFNINNHELSNNNIFCKSIEKKEEYSIFLNNTYNLDINNDNDNILLDTGSSTTGRKYLNEIIHLFINNKIPNYNLVIKTVPCIYNIFIKKKYNPIILKQNNIFIIKNILDLDNLIDIYRNSRYFIYASKYDGYGLSLALAIRYGLFIFCADGLPWNELLNNYPRKCYYKCVQDFSKSNGIGINKGYCYSQIYYKLDFKDLLDKLLSNDIYIKNNKILDNTIDEVYLFNNANNKNLTDLLEKSLFNISYKSINIIYTYMKFSAHDATEIFIKQTLHKYNINCELIELERFLKNQYLYSNAICFYNLKNRPQYLKYIKNKKNIIGYTFDYIMFNNLFKNTITQNINYFNKSFIVEDCQDVNEIKDKSKCMYIWQPTKIINYKTEFSVSDELKFIHIGSIYPDRVIKLINIAKKFPDVNIYLYGYNNILKRNIFKGRISNNISINKLLNYKNIKFITKNKLNGYEMYKLLKNNNTFILSFSITQKLYFSNRIPMLCGYRALVLQEYFNGINNYFSDKDMIIFKNTDELADKISNVINNYELQNKYRTNAFNISMKYTFDNYILEKFNKILF